MTEFYARQDYIYEGDSRIFTIPFDSIETRYIKVFVNDVACSAWYLLNESQVQIADWITLSVGDRISIRRETPINERMVIFSDKSILNEECQNLAQKQLFYSVQELYDNNTQFKNDVEATINTTNTELTEKVDTLKAELETKIADGDNDLQSQFDSFKNTVNLTSERLSLVEDGIVTTVAKANQATESANSAKEFADNAQKSADVAQISAEQAQNSATITGEKLIEINKSSETALNNIYSAKTETINQIKSETSNAKTTIENTGVNVVADITVEKDKSLTAIEAKKNEALEKIEEASTPSDDAFQNYYTKTQVNNLLNDYSTKSEVETSFSNVYTKAEVDNSVQKLSSNIYTKEEINTSFSNVYTKKEVDNTLADYYTKTQIDTKLDGISTLLDLINGEVV